MAYGGENHHMEGYRWLTGVKIIIRKGTDGLRDENHHTEGYGWLMGVNGMIRTAYRMKIIIRNDTDGLRG